MNCMQKYPKLIELCTKISRPLYNNYGVEWLFALLTSIFVRSWPQSCSPLKSNKSLATAKEKTNEFPCSI